MPIILENIIAEDRIDKIRIVNENDDVIGGQPELSGMSENDNNGLLDIACTLKKAQKDIEKQSTNITENYIHKDNISSDLNSDRTDYVASEKSVHDVNKKAISAQNTANTAVTNASTAQNRADSAYALAEKKIDKKSITSNLGNSTALVASQKLVSDVEGKIFGDNQKLIDVTEERSSNTIYTNNTGKMIWVVVSRADNAATEVFLYRDYDNEEFEIVRASAGSGAIWSFIVPAGYKYKVQRFKKWSELR